MGNILKLLDPYRWLVGGVIVATLIGGFMWYRHSLISEGERRAELAAATARAEAQALADAQARNMQEIADEAQAKYIKEVADARAAADRANAQLARLRNQAASAADLAAASQSALSAYAASAERDIDWCAERLVRTGETAAGASAAAHALYNAWPEYQQFQDRLTAFTQTLKKGN
jgi:colicin import membrane protein